jgi:hypothetical protein
MASDAESPKCFINVGKVCVTDPTGLLASQRAARSSGVIGEAMIAGML